MLLYDPDCYEIKFSAIFKDSDNLMGKILVTEILVVYQLKYFKNG